MIIATSSVRPTSDDTRVLKAGDTMTGQLVITMGTTSTRALTISKTGVSFVNSEAARITMTGGTFATANKGLAIVANGAASVSAVQALEISVTGNSTTGSTGINVIGSPMLYGVTITGWGNAGAAIGAALRATTSSGGNANAIYVENSGSYTGDMIDVHTGAGSTGNILRGTGPGGVVVFIDVLGNFQHTGAYVVPRAHIGGAANLLKYSEQFDQSPWVTSLATITADSGAGPDGTPAVADKITSNSGGGGYVEQDTGISGIANNTYTFSIWAKPLTSANIAVTVRSSAGDIAVTKNYASISVGQYEFVTASGTFGAGATGTLVFRVHQFINNGESELWGASLIAGSTLGGYVPTQNYTIGTTIRGASVNGTLLVSGGDSAVQNLLTAGDGQGATALVEIRNNANTAQRRITSGFHDQANDSIKDIFGTGNDAEIYYDATDLIIDPDVAGSGRVLIGATGDDDMLLNSIEVDGALNHDGTTVGFYGTTPAAQSAAYSGITNVSTDRTYDADSTSLDEIADVLGTLIADLRLTGIIG